MMGFLKEIFEVRRYLKAAKAAPNITFYSENGIYYQNFRGTIKTLLEKSDFTILYITSDKNDPIRNESSDRINVFFIKSLVSFVFPLISTKVLVLTLTDLDKFHLKRSSHPVNHIYMFHAINSIHLQYRRGAFDNYDTIFCVGPHHVEEIRKTEELYSLPAKQLVNVGYSWLEEIEEITREDEKTGGSVKILIAPSWNKGNILESCIDTILEKILPLSYEIVVRPHPEFIKREGDKVNSLLQKYGNHKNFVLETNSASFDNIKESNVLITDWSGIAIEFAFGMGKPIIFINTPKKIFNPEYKQLGIEPLEDQIREQIGTIIMPSDCSTIDQVIQEKFNKTAKNGELLFKLRNKSIFNWGNSSDVGADYIIDYCINTPDITNKQ